MAIAERGGSSPPRRPRSWSRRRTSRDTFGFTLPDAVAAPPGEGGTVNVPAVLIVLAVAGLLISGVRKSARTNTIMVFIKSGPLVPVFPIIGIGLRLYLMFELPGDTWLRFVVWMALGLVLYFVYGRRHSRLRGQPRRASATSAAVAVRPTFVSA
jgi:amino acid transporter